MEFVLKPLENSITVSRIANVHFFEFASSYFTENDRHPFCELVFVSDTYVSKESEATPTLNYANASFYALNATDFTVSFDNVKAYDLVKKYKAETPKYTN